MAKNKDKFKQAMSDGHSAAWDKEWQDAITFYTIALEEKPGDQKAISSIALAHFENRDFDEALRDYVHLAKISPSDPIPLEKISAIYEQQGKKPAAAEASLRAADLYFKLKNVDKAIENWIRTVGLDVESVHAHSRLALIYEKLEKKEQAVREYLSFASLMQQSGEMEKAVQGVNRALHIMPSNEEANKALVMLRDNIQLPKPLPPRFETTDPAPSFDAQEDSGDDFSETGINDPVAETHQKALESLALKFFDLTSSNNSQEAREKVGLQDFVDNAGGESEPSHFNLSQILLHLSAAIDLQAQGQHLPAAEELKGALDSGLNNVAAMFEIGYYHAQSDRLVSASRYLEMAAKDKEYALGANLILGDIYLELKKINEATQKFLNALKIADCSVVSPESVSDMEALYDPLIEGQKFVQNDEEKKQISLSIKDLLRREGWREHFINVRKQLAAADDDKLLIPVAELLLEAKSTYIMDAMTRVRSLARDGFFGSAMEEAFYMLGDAPTYLPMHIFIGDLLVNQGLKEDAMAKYLMVANSYNSRGDTGRSVELLRKVVKTTPMDHGPRQELIDLLLSLDAYEQAVQETVNLAEIHYQLADLNKAKETYSEALNLTQHPGVDHSWRSKILHRIADIDMQSLDWRNAIKNYEILLKLDGHDTLAVKHLVDLKVRMGQHKEAIQAIDSLITNLRLNQQESEILQFLSELVLDVPGQAPFHFRLAETLKASNQMEEAIIHFEKAGELFNSIGETAATISALKEILSIGPSNPKKYQKLIKKLES